MHVLKQSGKGAESLGLYLDDGRQFHFRPGNGGHDATSIYVYDRYRNRKLIAELDGPKAIRKFFADLKASP